MDSSLNVFNKEKENSEFYVPVINDDCGEFSFSCTSFLEPVDTSKMSEEVYDLFMFNREVFYLTESLWKDLLRISGLEEVLLENDLCYSIIDADNCTTLNKFFLSFNQNMVGLQRTNIVSNSRENYTDLLDDTLSTIQKFLQPTLPCLMENIELLIVKIKRSKNEKVTNSSHKAQNFGQEANKAIHKYLKHLRKAFTHFKIENVPDEIFEKKMNIEFEIEENYMNKSFFLGIPINEEDSQNYDDTNYIEESYDFDNTTDFYDNFVSTKADDVTDFFITTPNYITDEGFKTTENVKITTDFKISVHNNASIETVELQKQDLASFSSTENLEAEGFGSSKNIIIGSSIFTLIGLIAILIVFYVRKNMKKKQERMKERENMYSEEKENDQLVQQVTLV